MNILISGGSGLIGKYIIAQLEKKGYKTAVLSRQKSVPGYKTFWWDVENRQIDDDAIRFADAIINLTGTPIAGKHWSLEQKRKILNSRVLSNQLLLNTVERLQKPLSVFISASAIGYYGSVTRSEPFTENDAVGADFLGQTCDLWEKSADLFSQINIRTVKLRLGVVLAKNGGMLKAVLPVFRKNMGTPLGSGKQFLPWIHVKDAAGIFVHALENGKMQGVYNVVSPNPVTNKEFTKTLNNLLGKKQFLPRVPGFVLKITHGELAALILEGTPVAADKILSTGFKFRFINLENALKSIV